MIREGVQKLNSSPCQSGYYHFSSPSLLNVYVSSTLFPQPASIASQV